MNFIGNYAEIEKMPYWHVLMGKTDSSSNKLTVTATFFLFVHTLHVSTTGVIFRCSITDVRIALKKKERLIHVWHWAWCKLWATWPLLADTITPTVYITNFVLLVTGFISQLPFQWPAIDICLEEVWFAECIVIYSTAIIGANFIRGIIPAVFIALVSL
jgi:hypothetical protein